MDINISCITHLKKTQQQSTIMKFNITRDSFYNVTTFSCFIPELAESCSLYFEVHMQVLIKVTQAYKSGWGKNIPPNSEKEQLASWTVPPFADYERKKQINSWMSAKLLSQKCITLWNHTPQILRFFLVRNDSDNCSEIVSVIYGHQEKFQEILNTLLVHSAL